MYENERRKTDKSDAGWAAFIVHTYSLHSMENNKGYE